MNLSSPLDRIMRSTDAAILTTLRRVTGGLTGRRIQSLTGVTSRSGFVLALDELRGLGLVTREDVGNSSLYSLNRGHVLWPALEAMLESRTVVEGKIRDMVHRAFPDESTTVALFGSVARGDSTTESDIDLVMVFDGVVDDRREQVIGTIEREVHRITGNSVQVIDIDRHRLQEMTVSDDPLVASWRRESRTIAGPDLVSLIDGARV